MKKNYKVFRMMLMLALVLCTSMAYAQDQTISGKITDGSDGSGLPGVNILVKGTTVGTVTDVEGNYSLSVPESTEALLISSVGYLSQEIKIAGKSVIDLALSADVTTLEELVVVGYGTKKRKDITSAVSQITSKQIEASVQASPEFALQGTTSGILVQSASGDPNARPNIRIRGVGTLGFNDPLYVIDGVPISEFGAGVTAFASSAGANDIRGSQNILNLINPSDIASITVLKDAAATAVYGMRASNGVILIETKRGKGGRVSFNLSARRGVRNSRNTYDVLNTTDYTKLLTEEYTNAGRALPNFLRSDTTTYLGNGETYDWQSAIQNQNALTEDYSLSAQGGTEKANFYFSGAISNQESTLIYNKLKRYTATLSSDFQVADWLKVGETFRVAYSENDDSKGGIGGLDFVGQAFKPAWQPIYDVNDPTGFAPVRDKATGLQLWGDENGGTGVNHLAVGQMGFNHYNILRNLGSVYAEASPIEGLVFKGTLGIDWNSNKRERIRSRKYFRFHTNSNDQTDYLIRDLTNFSLLSEFLASYSKQIDDHNFNLLANISKQKIGTNWVQTGAVNPLFEDSERVGLSPSDSQAGESFKERKILSGTLLKLSYNFNSKYYLDASYRRDGSSVFAPGKRFGNFYGISGAWRVSDEAFMNDLSWLDDLKLRVSWGQTGNQETKAFSYLATISLNPRLATGNFDQSIIFGAFQPGFPNPDLSWETSSTTNIGFDGAAFNHRLGFSFDYYSRLTDDILQPLPLPFTIGINNSPDVNLAQVSNKGIELQLDWNDRIGDDIEYNFGVNLTTVKNRVVKLTDEIADGRVLANGYYGIQVGRSIGFIYGYQMDGIFQTQAEVDAWKAQHTDEAGSQDDLSPGDIRFADLFGNPGEGEFKSNAPDGLINANDKTALGKTIPGYFYGFNMGASYKQFDISLQWQGVGNVQKVNQVRASGEGMTGHANQLASVLNRWTPTNPSTTIPRALRDDPVGNTRFSSRIVEDADYLRLQNLQIGYTFGESVLDKLHLSNLRLYVSGNNIALFTKYSGLDPEVNLFSDTDFNPPATSWLLGMNLTF